MKTFTVILLSTALLVGAAVSQDKPAAPAHAFAGLNKCKICHKGEKNGNIYEIWEASPHAKAFLTLGSDEAKAVYAKLGKQGNPQEDAACLKCHITGAGAPAELTVNLKKEEGVTCEACHGAGGDYWKKTIMEVRAEAVKNGLVAEPKKGCIVCHNAESPTYKEFKVEEFYKKIEHHIPPKGN